MRNASQPTLKNSSSHPVEAHAPITVTQPSLPELAEFLPYLEEIWRSKTLTNGGRFHRKFESALAEYLGVPYVSLFANATIALKAWESPRAS